VEAQKKMADLYQLPVRITSSETAITNPKELLTIRKKELSQIWKRSPYQISRDTEELTFTCDYGGTPEVKANEVRVLSFSIENKTAQGKNISLTFKGIPTEYSLKGVPEGSIKIGPRSKKVVAASITPLPGAGNSNFLAEISDSGKTLGIQLGLIVLNKPKTSLPGK
jgi:hypothetical protein